MQGPLELHKERRGEGEQSGSERRCVSCPLLHSCHCSRILSQDGAGDATRVTLKLDTPEILKVKLVDDWENITKNQQVRGNCIHNSNPTCAHGTP